MSFEVSDSSSLRRGVFFSDVMYLIFAFVINHLTSCDLFFLWFGAQKLVLQFVLKI